ncbi:DUF2911 domain-containing protein [Paracrocinitomix mangrovi]|uniref:DUF2911 domain-containing protein n=1 Tax=Paracrocinitomix mangrovi TaxID=2862509 RepID=UPI001C8E1066|nr:DUF2911 domain-containing protein [Paracrocinitomix mangrovi]UKN00678.1 DUF2911 domain-containing protein [Paracrocinitomix mangrovi]
MKYALPFLAAVFFLSCKGGEENGEEQTTDTDSTIEVNTQSEEIEENQEQVERKSPRQDNSYAFNGITVKVNYGSPRVKNRVIWGDLVPFNEVWRAGADEVTAVTFDQTVKIDGKKVNADTYGLFIIPRQTGNWTVIFNEEWSQEEHGVWGAFNYKENKDVIRFEVSPLDLDDSVENMTFRMEGNLFIFEWDRKRFEFPIEKA